MKKFYVLASAMLLSAAAFAQTVAPFHGVVNGTRMIPKQANPERLTCPDTTGIVNFVDFLPEYAPAGGTSLNFGYSGGGYVFGNNVDGAILKKVAQGYSNLNGTPVKVTDLMVYFVGKESDVVSTRTNNCIT